MALFARRSLQRLLDELEGALSVEARSKLAREFDRKDASALGFEWELALLYALSRVTAQELFAEYSRPGEPIDNPFGRALNRGLTIDFVGLTKVPNCDDDLIEIRFSGPDPAISKLKVESPSGAD
jgi:hypothetical protein